MELAVDRFWSEGLMFDTQAPNTVKYQKRDMDSILKATDFFGFVSLDVQMGVIYFNK